MPSQPAVALYMRCSSDQQSIDSQARDLRTYVEQRGWTNVREYQDIGYSGSKDSRPAWDECWKAVRQKKVRIVVCTALDRLGRSLSHLAHIINTIVELDCALISLREGFDCKSASGRFQAQLWAMIGEYELNLIRERTRAGMRAAKARGSRIGPRKNYLCTQKAIELLDRGVGQIKVAKALGVGVGRINQFVHEEYLPAKRLRELAASVATMDEADDRLGRDVHRKR